MSGTNVGLHRRVAHDLGVDDPLDSIELLAGDGLEMDEIEAEPIGCDERSGLLDMRPEHLPERRVQQMRCGVVSACPVPKLTLNFGGDEVPRSERAARDAHA